MESTNITTPATKPQQSEVRWLMQQIDAESTAAWAALYGPATVARHDFIKARYDRLGELGNQLARITSEDTAIDVISQSLDRQAPQ
jgi:hypothetical protein